MIASEMIVFVNAGMQEEHTSQFDWSPHSHEAHLSGDWKVFFFPKVSDIYRGFNEELTRTVTDGGGVCAE